MKTYKPVSLTIKNKFSRLRLIIGLHALRYRRSCTAHGGSQWQNDMHTHFNPNTHTQTHLIHLIKEPEMEPHQLARCLISAKGSGSFYWFKLPHHGKHLSSPHPASLVRVDRSWEALQGRVKVT